MPKLSFMIIINNFTALKLWTSIGQLIAIFLLIVWFQFDSQEKKIYTENNQNKKENL